MAGSFICYISSIELFCDICNIYLFYLHPHINKDGTFNEILAPATQLGEDYWNILLHSEIEDAKRRSITRFDKPCPRCGSTQLSMKDWYGYLSFPRRNLNEYNTGFDNSFKHKYTSPKQLSEVKKSVHNNTEYTGFPDFKQWSSQYRAGFLDGLNQIQEYVTLNIQRNSISQVPEY